MEECSCHINPPCTFCIEVRCVDSPTDRHCECHEYKEKDCCYCVADCGECING